MRLTERLKAQTWEPAFLGLDSALQLMSWGTLGKLLNLSVSFSHYFLGLVGGAFICKVLKPMPSPELDQCVLNKMNRLQKLFHFQCHFFPSVDSI